MKKYIYILIAALTAIIVASCSASRNLSESDENTHVVVGVGWSDTSIGDAQSMAYAEASELLTKENNTTVESDYESTTRQKMNGKRINEIRENIRHLRLYSESTYTDSDIKYVELTDKERRKWKINERFAYKAIVKTDRDNVEQTSR